MKSTKTTKKWTSIILAVLLIFGCCAVAFADPASAGSGSMSDNYETYFTRVHGIAKFPDADGKYTVKDGAIYLRGIYLGWSDNPDERQLLDDVLFYDAYEVEHFRATDSYIYFAEKGGCDIRRLNTTTMRVDTIYEGDAPIAELDGDDTCLFFRAGNRIYRMYVKTGEAYEVFRIPDLVHYELFLVWNDRDLELTFSEPADDEPLTISMLTEHRAEPIDGLLAYMLNCNTGAVHGQTQNEYYAMRKELGINMEEHYGTDGGLAIFPNLAIRSKLRSFYNQYPTGSVHSAAYGGGTQCMAFARKVYGKYLYNRPAYSEFSWYVNGTRYHNRHCFYPCDGGFEVESHQYIDISLVMMQSIPDGSHVRVHGSNTNKSNSGHSLIIVGHTPTTLVVYDTNRNDNNVVYATEFTFNEFKLQFKNAIYYDNPQVSASHSHDFNLVYMATHTTHMKYCSGCCSWMMTENHRFNQVEIAGTQYHQCIGCGYEYPVN